ncbi:unnamed protein product, partial [Meganyctiphanes norvegica]
MSKKKFSTNYDSAFEDDEAHWKKKEKHKELVSKERRKKSGLPAKSSQDATQEEGRRMRFQLSSLTAYDRHKMLINHYLLYHPGATKKLERDVSRDKRDIDVIRENHQFLWEDDDAADTWEQQLAKKYYDKLFKEYCICDLTRYKENQIGMRWRIEREVVSGKGQFSCGEKHCSINENLRSWEMNFGYVEHGIKKNALIKLRLCHDCSYQVNYSHKRKEVTKNSKKRKGDRKQKKRKKHKHKRERESESSSESSEEEAATSDPKDKNAGEDIWKGPAKILDEKSREEEFDEYLEDLFL